MAIAKNLPSCRRCGHDYGQHSHITAACPKSNHKGYFSKTQSYEPAPVPESFQAQPVTETALDFFSIRNTLLGKVPYPSEETILLHKSMDRNKNPYNDPGKPLHRSTAEIYGDIAAEFADATLTQIYGKKYTVWLKEFNSK